MSIDIIIEKSIIIIRKRARAHERRTKMMTMKEAFAKAHGHEAEYNAYDEYLDEMKKKYDCERARIFKQREFRRETRAWEDIRKKVTA